MPRPRKAKSGDLPPKKEAKNRLTAQMPRAIWSGSISFGLVNIPVRLHSAVKSNDIRFHMLHKKDNVRVKQKLVCPAENKEVERDDIVKGFEIAPEQYVVIKDEELEALEPEAGRSIDILQFTELKSIDPLYFDKPYYLLPDERAAKAYALLVKAMESSGKAAIGRFTMRGKQYLAALRPIEGVVCLETMRYAAELLYAGQLEWLPPAADVGERELHTAKQLVDSLTADFEPEKMKDEYREAVLAMIEKKADGRQIVIHEPQVSRKREAVDLMSALERSLAEVQKTRKKPAPVPAARRS